MVQAAHEITDQLEETDCISQILEMEMFKDKKFAES